MSATLIEVPVPFIVSEKKSTSTPAVASPPSNPSDAVIFVGVSLVLGIACRHLLRGSRVPYTVALIIIGVGIGCLEYGTKHGLGRFGDGIRLWENIDPELLLAVFLPALLFESSFSMEIHQIKRCFVQMLLLAGPGVLISTFCLGSALKFTFPYGWSWTTSLLLGGLLSATDPVAVVALLKELGASKKLSTIIEGESLMNDGTAIVVYQLFFQMVLGRSFSGAAIVKYLAEVSLGAVGIGIAFGIVSVLWLGYIFSDTVIEISLTLAVSYVAYFTAQEGAEVSGVLTVMTLGMFYAAAARTAFKGESQESLHHFWEMVAYIANTLIFILSGTVIAQGVLSSDDIFQNHGISWGYLILLYVYVQVSRAVVVGVLFPFLQYFGYGLDWKESLVLIWSGLRGAVALSLSLSVKRSSGDLSHISSQTGTLFVFFTGGIVFLTLTLNGSTTQFLLQVLGLSKLSEAKSRILEFTKYEMEKKALEAFGGLGEDEELGPADWPTVKRYIKSLRSIDGERIHPHDASRSTSILHLMNLKDMRVRLLNGVQAAYWMMLDEGRITQSTANILMLSVDEALDSVAHEPLSDWKGLKRSVHFPTYYKFLRDSICPKKLVTFFTVERLESSCYICAAFLRAHRIACRQLNDFIGDSEISSVVINESEAEREEAKNFLEDVRVTFPEVLQVVKTRQSTHVVLKHLVDYIESLEKSGILEKKEMVHLHDAVQTDLKKILRNPPAVKTPKLRERISVHPLLGPLQTDLHNILVGCAKEEVKVRGVTLYKEGSKPNGIWLISNGVVKWTSKNISGKHALHPTFTYGSTLGLYEVLLGKAYICDMVTDSAVVCFFIEVDKLQSVLNARNTDPAMEDFFWKESAIVLAKILLPQVFENMSMLDMRKLTAERSTTKTYLRDETIEVPGQVIAILMEGFIKSHSLAEDLITPPAVLWPAKGNSSFLNQNGSGFKSTSFSYQKSTYHVEARATLILFDMAAFHADKTLQSRNSSLLVQNHSSQSLSRDHRGLLSWPEQYFESAQQQRDGGGTDENRNNLSAIAMQLSIYGSKVPQVGLKTFKQDGHRKPSHSQSYPRFPAAQQQPLISVRSEGSSTVRKGRNEQLAGNDVPPPSSRRQRSHALDESSDDSGAEEEVIVRIDSPSRLSFPLGS